MRRLKLNKLTIAALTRAELKEIKGQSVIASGCAACLTEKPECSTELICHTKTPCEN